MGVWYMDWEWWSDFSRRVRRNLLDLREKIEKEGWSEEEKEEIREQIEKALGIMEKIDKDREIEEQLKRLGELIQKART